MKNRLILAIIPILILITLMAGCQGGDSPSKIIPSSGRQSEKTDFVIYRPPYTDNWLAKGIAIFNQTYKDDVNLIVEDFSTGDYETNRAAYRDRVTIELMAGSGPDIIFPYWLDIDLNKSMMNGLFLDLSPYFEQDKNFRKEDYLTNIFEAGCYDGKQYVVPLMVETPFLISNTSKIEEIGLSGLDLNITDFLNYISEISVFSQENPAFSQMMHSKEWFRPFCNFSNIPIIDYSTKQVCPDEEALRAFFESYKRYYPFDCGQDEKEGFFLDTPITEEFYFDKTYTPTIYIATASLLQNCGGYTVSTIHGNNGEVVATYTDTVVVRANTNNPEYAYRFIQILLSPEVQTSSWTTPICRQAIIDTAQKRQDSPYNKRKDAFVQTKLTEKEFQAAIDLYDSINTSRLPNETIYDMVWIAMEPFFKDEKSYETCFSEMKSRLILYKDE